MASFKMIDWFGARTRHFGRAKQSADFSRAKAAGQSGWGKGFRSEAPDQERIGGARARCA
jgi:hypothetical protein